MSRFTVLAMIFWIACGFRFLQERNLTEATPLVPLSLPFSELPLDLLGPGWERKEVPLSDRTLRVAKVTDYVQRLYTRADHNVWLYVGYVGRWDPGALHHPEICFPHVLGLEPLRKTTVPIPIPGVEEPPGFNEFLWRSDLGSQTYTLYTFYFNGRFEPNLTELRAFRILGVRYFAIITFSGTLAGSLEETRRFYSDLMGKVVPTLLEHFPDGRKTRPDTQDSVSSRPAERT